MRGKGGSVACSLWSWEGREAAEGRRCRLPAARGQVAALPGVAGAQDPWVVCQPRGECLLVQVVLSGEYSMVCVICSNVLNVVIKENFTEELLFKGLAWWFSVVKMPHFQGMVCGFHPWSGN